MEFKPNSIYYYFGIFSDQTADESNPKVPNGVYTFDNTYSFQPGVFDDSFSAYYVSNDTECNWQLFIDGRVEVSDNHIDAVVTLADGSVHHVTYDGDLTLKYPENSTLSGDYNFRMTDAYIEACNYGDYYAAGGNNWLVYVFPDYEIGTGEGFWLDIIAHDYNEQSIAGEYICKEAYVTGVFFPGFTAAGIYYGSWYIDYENLQVEPTSFTIDILPDNKRGIYILYLTTEAYLNQSNLHDDESLYTDDIEYFKYHASEQNISLEEYLNQNVASVAML